MTASKMRAAILTGPGKASIDEAPVPEPGPGQVRIRLSGCGVCASNLEPWAGPEWMEFPTAPGALGHEGWGRVDAVGRGVTRLREGDAVAALFHHSYAEYDTGDAGAVVALPAPLEDRPFPAEPIGCAINVFERSDIRAGQTVAIVGAGFIGSLLTRLASRAGARVIALSRRPDSLDNARLMGAHHLVSSQDTAQALERVRELTDGRLCERVIEATGKQGPLDLAAELTAERGRLVIAGYHQDGPRQVNMQMWNWRGIDVINAHERAAERYVDGMRKAVRAVESGEIDPTPLFTHMLPLERLGEALDLTRDRPPGFAKALVVMN